MTGDLHSIAIFKVLNMQWRIQRGWITGVATPSLKMLPKKKKNTYIKKKEQKRDE